MSHKAKNVFIIATLATLASCSDDAPVPEGVDFIVTVQLETEFTPAAVDRLDTVFQAGPTDYLDDSEGSEYDGGMSWYTQRGSRGDEFVVSVTGDFFGQNAVQVARDTYEIDLPFLGGATEAEFGLRSFAYWTDEGGEESEIGEGSTSVMSLPIMDPYTRVVIEVSCRQGWDYTCRTGCPAGVSDCETDGDCGGQSCHEGCCPP